MKKENELLKIAKELESSKIKRSHGYSDDEIEIAYEYAQGRISMKQYAHALGIQLSTVQHRATGTLYYAIKIGKFVLRKP